MKSYLSQIPMRCIILHHFLMKYPESIEIESSLVVARNWGSGEMVSDYSIDTECDDSWLFWCDEKVLKLEGGGGDTALWIH